MIPDTENETTEFKKSLTQLDKGLIALTAMLNRHTNGTVYFGIDDDGRAVSVNIGKNTLDDIDSDIRNKIEPRIIPDIEVIYSDDGKKIISVSAKGSDIPYSYDGRYYVRNVTANEKATPLMLRRMLMSGKDDLLTTRKSPTQELTFHLFDILMRSKKAHTDLGNDFLGSQNLKDNDGDYNMVAYLVSDQNNFHMQVVRFDGTDKSVMSHRKEFDSNFIITKIDSMIGYIDSLDMPRVKLSKGIRKEMHLFDIECVREAIINAYVHNNWLGMLPPSVFVFDDRIEIQSYGTIPVTLSLDEFYSGKSVPVNKALFELFRYLGLTEQSGHGIPIITDTYGKECITIGTDTVTVTIPFAFEPDWVKSRKNSEIEVELTRNEERILEYVKKNKHATNSDITKATNIRPATAGRAIATLKNYGMLLNEGNNRINSWKVTELRSLK